MLPESSHVYVLRRGENVRVLCAWRQEVDKMRRYVTKMKTKKKTIRTPKTFSINHLLLEMLA